VSSVYFFYDPDYAFLSLGIWSALHELSLVPNSPLLPDLKYYYLGYYVHSCPKMRYKKQFAPAEVSVRMASLMLSF
jgi:arginine-tRNA-protein transferase